MYVTLPTVSVGNVVLFVTLGAANAVTLIAKARTIAATVVKIFFIGLILPFCVLFCVVFSISTRLRQYHSHASSAV